MPLFLKPVFQERIWGGTKLTEFGYDIPYDNTGECWAISAHPNGANTILNGRYKNYTLDQVWEENRALFGNDDREAFPLLTKILDAQDKLSVQVHPDDAYAKAHEGEYGKTECWYILDAEEDAEIIYGVNAQNQETLNNMIDNREFDQLFNTVKVQKGDFYYVPAGTVHAIGKGIMILETQQSSDTTYRIYDYDRTDKNGEQRALHLEESKEVIDLSQTSPNATPKALTRDDEHYTQLVASPFFTVEKWNVSQQVNFKKPQDYCLVSIIEGSGEIIVDGEAYELEKGQHFVLTSEDNAVQFNGELTMIVSYV
ncbi:mannose-6-phosphate isomerase, class I [Staphylococcus sp. 18_1_E_LY]|uniref:Mannose-6-phosphate isomerase n=1 Tax=Staphylococcus lloydii TaxID=2781774 RepID=A0A7T1B0M5_9STAP|nr:mannose-6-phosphate isomerase, class I [Staphylococcus lloydii]MBF7020181.1 mannose-6-phosphate isomerase, class I [Staphylococcus lloydii]MBF7027864.1 mannose-6-phosphate isomerase, class I [Staphylococcus lloydii]QPM75536.1 mannose-6-phosphate isomerase, class I [Staphylococcus lloydii]